MGLNTHPEKIMHQNMIKMKYFVTNFRKDCLEK